MTTTRTTTYLGGARIVRTGETWSPPHTVQEENTAVVFAGSGRLIVDGVSRPPGPPRPRMRRPAGRPGPQSLCRDNPTAGLRRHRTGRPPRAAGSR
ncbi:hypothetical protein ACWDCB_07850 [Streptomyces sp. NPDC001178]